MFDSALAAKHLSVWGGVQSACQGTAMLTLHLVADRFGRKKGFYVIWVALAAGIAAESFGRTWKTWLVAKMFSGFAVGGVQVGCTSRGKAMWACGRPYSPR
jgi:SP family general alpha glucoside:H+ symporter-like MFS transporter